MSMIRFAARRFLSRQFARPSGLFGRIVMGRLLNRTTQSHNALVLEELSVAPSDRVIEIGFGGGALLEETARRTTHGFVAGIELSDEMVDTVSARLKGPISEGLVELHRGSVESLPYPEGHFDSACSVNTVYFWPDLTAAFKEVFRVLRPGGKLILGYVGDKDVRRAGLDREGFLVYSTDELRKSLEETGFRTGGMRSGTDRRGTYYTLMAERPA
jgi:arsenite methyltransferase